MHLPDRSGVLAVATAMACVSAALGACFSNSSGGPDRSGPSFDASLDGPGFDSSSSDSTTPDSPADVAPEGGPQDAAAADAASDGGTLCTLLDLSTAPFVNTEGNVTGAPPAMTGGAIVAGDYAQSSVVAYDPAGTTVSGESPVRSLIRFGASDYQADTQVWFPYDASPDSPPSAENVVVFDFVTDGSVMTTTAICNLLNPDAAAQVASHQYTATSTTYQFPRVVAGDAGIVEIVTYTKQ